MLIPWAFAPASPATLRPRARSVLRPPFCQASLSSTASPSPLASFVPARGGGGRGAPPLASTHPATRPVSAVRLAQVHDARRGRAPVTSPLSFVARALSAVNVAVRNRYPALSVRYVMEQHPSGRGGGIVGLPRPAHSPSAAVFRAPLPLRLWLGQGCSGPASGRTGSACCGLRPVTLAAGDRQPARQASGGGCLTTSTGYFRAGASNTAVLVRAPAWPLPELSLCGRPVRSGCLSLPDSREQPLASNAATGRSLSLPLPLRLWQQRPLPGSPGLCVFVVSSRGLEGGDLAPTR